MSASYGERSTELTRQLGAGASVRLRKTTSNLFRNRSQHRGARINVEQFNHVLRVATEEGWVDIEGMAPYDAIIAAALPKGVMPCVVPQLRSITIGGALAGVGIESSSFRYGLVHETVKEFDVLVADGSIVTCRPDNEHRELFFGFPNSYGTLGYALRVRASTIPVKPYVRITHHRYDDPDSFFAALDLHCRSQVDFVDGVVFSPRTMYVVVGEFADSAPYTSDYTYQQIYYRSIQERSEDYLSTEDYLWRWDTDWFWCSKNLMAQNPLVRRLLGRKRLNSRFYQRVMRWNGRWRLMQGMERLAGLRREAVIQDVDIPLPKAPDFLRFFNREIGILPVWICPVRRFDPRQRFPLFDMKPDTLYVNFGFWDVLRTRQRHPPGHFNRLIENQVWSLGGIKSLYSDSYYSREEFWANFDLSSYAALKERYDPEARFGDLYQKCVTVSG